MHKLCGLTVSAVLTVVLACASASFAQGYPTKPVRIVIGFTPGGPSDSSTRIIAEDLGRTLGQPFLIENKPGAGGNLAADTVAHAAPDGYTLFLANSGAFSVNPSLYATLPFDPVKDFTPITMTVTTPLVIIVGTNSPAKTLGDLIAMIKRDGAAMNYGTPGIGTLPHIAGEILKERIGGKSTHVPYRGSAQEVEGVMKGEVQWSVDAPVTAVGPLKAGQIRLLAISSEKRLPILPDVPTTAEAGIPELNDGPWYALVGPAGLPNDIVAKLHGATVAALRKPEVIERMTPLGLEPKPMTPAETAAYMAATRERWAKVIKATGMKVE
jgi:tripartite-type tricarboxylate transporter receptor subunit TctC